MVEQHGQLLVDNARGVWARDLEQTSRVVNALQQHEIDEAIEELDALAALYGPVVYEPDFIKELYKV